VIRLSDSEWTALVARAVKQALARCGPDEKRVNAAIDARFAA